MLKECVSRLPHEDFVYLADKANMPYGGKSCEQIKSAALYCADTLFGMNCKAIVIACNTATETAVEYIRELYKREIVIGLEPAVKPCFRELCSGEYGVALVTEATAKSRKFRALVDGCENRIIVSPQPELAELIERGADLGTLRAYVGRMLLPYRDAAAVALGCSHYSHIAPLVSEFYGGKVRIYDGALGASARLETLLKESGEAASDGKGGVRFFATEKKRTL